MKLAPRSLGSFPLAPLLPLVLAGLLPSCGDRDEVLLNAEARFHDDGSGWARIVRGRLEIPEGAPEDPTLAVIALTSVNPFVLDEFGVTVIDREANGPSSRSEFIEQAVDRAAVADDGSFELTFPPKTEVGWIVVDGRFLYVDRPIPVFLRWARGEAVIRPELGGWLPGTLEGEGSGDGTGEESTTGEVHLVWKEQVVDVDSWGSAAGGSVFLCPHHDCFEIACAVGASFELRGVPAGRAFSVNAHVPGSIESKTGVAGLDPGEARAIPIDLASALSTPITSGPGGTISGVVLDEEGNPIPDALVLVGIFPEHRTRTDELGRFRSDRLEPGPIRVAAGAEGYFPSADQELTIEGPDSMVETQIVLEAGRTFAGRIVRGDGTPVINASVGMHAVERDESNAVELDDSYWESLSQRATLAEVHSEALGRLQPWRPGTDENGEFVIRGLPEARYELAIYDVPPRVGESTIRFVGGQEIETIDLDQTGGTWTIREGEGYSVKAAVVDLEGRPVPRFRLWGGLGDSVAYGVGLYLFDFPFGHLLHNDEGTFVFHGLYRYEEAPDVKWWFAASAPGLISKGPIAVGLPQDPDAALPRIVMGPPTTLVCLVVDPDGRPVSGARVIIDPAEFPLDRESARVAYEPISNPVELSLGRTGLFGHLVIDQKLGEIHRLLTWRDRIPVSAWAEGYAASAGFDADFGPGGGESKAVLRLRHGGSLRGRFDSNAFDKKCVVRLQLTDSTFVVETKPDADGSFVVENLIPGRWRVSIARKHHGVMLEKEPEIRSVSADAPAPPSPGVEDIGDGDTVEIRDEEETTVVVR